MLQKRPFWRPRAPPFQAKTPIMNSYKNIDIYSCLNTSRGSKYAQLGTPTPTLNPSGHRRSFWDAFFGLSGHPGAPESRKGTQKGSQSRPEGTQHAPQIGLKSAPGAPGLRNGSRGHPPDPKWPQNGPKMVPNGSPNGPEMDLKLSGTYIVAQRKKQGWILWDIIKIVR